MSKPVKVFISYAHKDEQYKEELTKRLKPYESRNIIEAWDDRKMLPGQDWHTEINNRLQWANVILYLVSPDFMASDYINDVELAKAMERHHTGEQRLVPIIIRPSDLSILDISKFQAVPKNAKPVTTFNNQDEAWLDVITALSKLFSAIKEGSIELKSRANGSAAVANTPSDSVAPNATDFQTIQTLIQKSRLEEAIERMLVITATEKYAYHNNSVIMQSGALSELKRKETNFVISDEQATRTRARIRLALLSILENLEAE